MRPARPAAVLLLALAPATLVPSLGLALALPSCTPSGAPPVVPVEVIALDKMDGGAPFVTSARGASDDKRCEARVSLNGRIRTGATCQLDEQISHGAGRMRYPCTGDGPVEVEFGSHRFAGSLLSGRVSLELTTELDWDDHCHWETRQTMAGMLRGNTLRWSYTEKPVQGTGCFAACTASADIRVVTPGSPGPPSGDDDDDTPDF